MASSIVSLARFVSVVLAAAAPMLSSVGAGTLDAVKQAKTIRLAVRDDAPRSPTRIELASRPVSWSTSAAPS